jgi:uncharacterized membrane protein YdjX (TVP38/TMEM64 family)
MIYRRYIAYTFIVAAILIAMWVFFYVIFPYLTSEELQEMVRRIAPFGPLVIIFYTVLAHIIVPLAGIPATLVGVPIFGIYQTMLYIYIGSMISAAINFYISRTLGRAWVVRLAGTRTMKKIDEFVASSGTGVLIAARIFGIAAFEEISYAVGLTNMRFWRYMSITLLASVIPHAIFAYAFRNTDFQSGSYVALLLGVLIAIGIIFGMVLRRYIKYKNSV